MKIGKQKINRFIITYFILDFQDMTKVKKHLKVMQTNGLNQIKGANPWVFQMAIILDFIIRLRFRGSVAKLESGKF